MFSKNEVRKSSVNTTSKGIVNDYIMFWPETAGDSGVVFERFSSAILGLGVKNS